MLIQLVDVSSCSFGQLGEFVLEFLSQCCSLYVVMFFVCQHTAFCADRDVASVTVNVQLKGWMLVASWYSCLLLCSFHCSGINLMNGSKLMITGDVKQLMTGLTGFTIKLPTIHTEHCGLTMWSLASLCVMTLRLSTVFRGFRDTVCTGRLVLLFLKQCPKGIQEEVLWNCRQSSFRDTAHHVDKLDS